jgi:hypothetical protein
VTVAWNTATDVQTSGDGTPALIDELLQNLFRFSRFPVTVLGTLARDKQ